MKNKEVKARICGGNIKLGNMGTFSTLYSDKGFFIRDLNMVVTGTCGRHCTYCAKDCYVRKSYRYGSVMLRHALNTLAIRQDVEKVFNDLNAQLSRKRVPFKTVRINQSGEIGNASQFIMWEKLATAHNETVFYIYTKNYDVAILELLAGNVPDNMVVLFSIWHEQGIEEWNLVKHLPNTKCFVYDDGFDYTAYGLEIETYCTAYGPSGKLDHNITCDKCKKCFGKTFKVIGTLPH